MTTRLLVLDDRPVNLKLLRRYLGARGFTVFSASTVAEADELLTQEAVSMVLAEVFMPREDALGFVQRLKSRGGPAVIAVSSHVLTAERNEAFAAGCAEFIAKPVELAKLVEVIRRRAGSEEQRS